MFFSKHFTLTYHQGLLKETSSIVLLWYLSKTNFKKYIFISQCVCPLGFFSNGILILGLSTHSVTFFLWFSRVGMYGINMIKIRGKNSFSSIYQQTVWWLNVVNTGLSISRWLKLEINSTYFTAVHMILINMYISCFSRITGISLF